MQKQDDWIREMYLKTIAQFGIEQSPNIKEYAWLELKLK